MSRAGAKNRGNGKIHRYPLRVCKILCVSKEAYSRLKLVIKGFERKKRVSSSPKEPLRKRRIPVKARPRVPETVNAGYEPTDIGRTRNSSQWKWQRVNEWFNEYGEFYNITE